MRCLTLRAFLVAACLLILGNLWVRQAELVTLSCQVSMSVPPIPALAGLVFLLLMRPVMRLISRRLVFSQGEVLVIYVLLTLGIALASGGALRTLVPSSVALQYFTTPENGWEQFHEFLPTWIAPASEEAVRGFFEATETGVPWGEWLVPLGAWLLFILLLFASLHFLAEIFTDPWADRERLGFSMNELPLSLAGAGGESDEPALWKDPVMWIGFGLVTIHNGLNIAHAFNPSVPALGLHYDVGALFQERPLSALRPMLARWRPEVVGFGYLMPLEITYSVIFAYGLLVIEKVGAVAMGYDIPRFPYSAPQSSGCFIALAAVLVWAARRHIRRSVETRPGPVIGFVVSVAGVIAWWHFAGMSVLTALGFFFLVFAFSLSYSRLRCEAVVPLQWAFPVSQQYDLLMAVFGSRAFETHHSFRNLTVLSLSRFLARGYVPMLGAYQFEGIDLARRARIPRREIAATLMLAVLLGAILSMTVQLVTYYQYGANFLEGGTHSGGMRVGSARYAFRLVERFARSPEPARTPETLAMAWGMAATIGLTAVRHAFLAFPISPLGFVLGTVRGYRIWAPLGIAAIVKSLALRIGGVGLYRRLVPGALGIVLGHFVVAGAIWSLVGAFGGEAFRAYQVWFG